MITNKDIRVENGSLIINGDPYPLDGQSPETIMEIVKDNSDTTPTENSTAPITSGGVYTALANKQSVVEQVDFVDVSVTWPTTGTDMEKVQSVASQVCNNLSTTKAFSMINIKDGQKTLGVMIYGRITFNNYGIGIFMSYYIEGFYKVKNANGIVTVKQLAEVS